MSSEYFKIALRNMRSRSLRSSLSILGIVIGVFLVVSLISVARGVADEVDDLMSMVGADLIIVLPVQDFGVTGMFTWGGFREHELDAIRRAEGLDKALEMTMRSYRVRHYTDEEIAILWGIDYVEGIPYLEEMMGLEIAQGRLPRPGMSELAVGSLVPREFFPDMRAGDEVTIGGRRFTVAGVLRSLGHRENDLSIMMDIDEYRSVTGDRDTQVVFGGVKEGYDPKTVGENIERELGEAGRRARGEEEPVFSVITAETYAEVAGGIMFLLQFATLAFAGIAVVVGAIGIMNSMFTAVRERTKEIGVLKAVGARKRDIISVFLIESGIIGFVGGVIGLVLGIGAAKAAEYIITEAQPMLYVEAHISFTLIFLSLFFSFLVGAVAGYLPARQAAMKNPVDALSYE